MGNENTIIMIRPDGKPGIMLPLTQYEAAKESIIEYFLTKSQGTIEEIISSAMNRLKDSHTEDLVSILSSVILDMEARDYITKLSYKNPIEYGLKVLHC